MKRLTLYERDQLRARVSLWDAYMKTRNGGYTYARLYHLYVT
jgi:hypothetical protein